MAATRLRAGLKRPVFHPAFVVAFGTLTLALATGVPAGADSVDDARRRVEAMADSLEAAENEVDRLSEELRIAEDDKTNLDASIVATESEIVAKEAEVDAMRTDMSEIAVTAFVSGGRTGSITGLLTPGAGPNDAVQKQALTDMALNTGLASTDQLDSLIDDLDDLRKNLERDRRRAEELAARIVEAREDAEGEIAKYTELKAEAERELGQAIVEERNRRARAAAARAAEEAARLAGSRPSGGSGATGGASGGSSGGGQNFDPSTVPPSTSRGGIVVAAARSQIGVRYKYAAAEEGVAFDCSGLTMWAWQQAGVYLPHQSRRQFNSSPQIPKEFVEPGDLLFFYNPITHVGIYAGGGMMIDAPGVGRTVRLTPVSWGKVVGVTRPG
jgi:cell wall-associated NlpC family hydrolase